MPQNRVAMRKIREILRLAWACGQTRHSTANSCGIGKTTVTDTLYRASAAGLSYPLPSDLDDEQLEHLLYPVHPRAITSRTPPDWASLHNELLSHKNLTLMLLWQGVQGARTLRLLVQSVLRPVPLLAGEARPLHASGTPCWREDVRGLLRSDGSHC